MRQDNTDLSMALQSQENHNAEMAMNMQAMETKLKKAQVVGKSNKQIKRDVKDKDREAHKMRKEIIDLKHQNQRLSQLLKEYKDKQIIRVSQPRMMVTNGSPSQQSHLEFIIKELQSKLHENNEQLTLTTSDKMRFKELAEKYMQAVSRLESQLEQADIKPVSKLSQRPKDTEVRSANLLKNSSS